MSEWPTGFDASFVAVVHLEVALIQPVAIGRDDVRDRRVPKHGLDSFEHVDDVRRLAAVEVVDEDCNRMVEYANYLAETSCQRVERIARLFQEGVRAPLRCAGGGAYQSL